MRTNYTKILRRARRLWRYGLDRHWYRSQNSRKIGRRNWVQYPGGLGTTVHVSRDLSRRLQLTGEEGVYVARRLVRTPITTPGPWRSLAAVARCPEREAARTPGTPEPGITGTTDVGAKGA